MANDDLLKLEILTPPTFTRLLSSNTHPDQGRSLTTISNLQKKESDWSNLDQVIISGPIRNGQEVGRACLVKKKKKKKDLGGPYPRVGTVLRKAGEGKTPPRPVLHFLCPIEKL